MKIILFNGPPYSGKDTAATALASHWNGRIPVRWERFSMPIKRAFAGTLDLACDTWGNVVPWERRKEMTIPEIGVSYRQWQIKFSEEFLKPLCGDGIFGSLLVDRLTQRAREKDVLFLIPDLGFQLELDALTTTFFHKDIFVYKITRPGCEWDSRSPVTVTDTVQSLSVMNDRSLVEFEHTIVKVSESWVTRE